MHTKVSVILPSLNVVSYIEECLESVINQTLKDIEIICVDAGSKDGTAEILERYAQKDSRIKVLHSPKKSYGFQVNMGIDTAQGEYIGVVDTDDFVRADMYETLFSYAIERDADFVRGDFEVFLHAENGERLFMPYNVNWACSAQYGKCFTKEDYAESMSTPDVFLWNGIYKRSFLVENDIRFNETPGAAIQDCGVRYKIALCVERGYFIQKPVYCYRRDNAGASSYSSKIISNHFDEFKSVVEFASARNDISDKQWSFLAREVAIITFRTYHDLLIWSKADEDAESILEAVRGIVRDINKRNVLSGNYMTPNALLESSLFMDKELCDGYAKARARAIREGLLCFLENLASKKKVWIFGSKKVADYAYVFLKNNGINNIAGFFDNDTKRQGMTKFGLPIVNPKEVIDKEREAFFLIASSNYIDDIKKWLADNGVERDRYLVYGGAFEQLLHPFICTNVLLKENL